MSVVTLVSLYIFTFIVCQPLRPSSWQWKKGGVESGTRVILFNLRQASFLMWIVLISCENFLITVSFMLVDGYVRSRRAQKINTGIKHANSNVLGAHDYA